jgi:hypothetical protein
MGCHLYINRIDNNQEVSIPFLSVPLLDGYKILTKKELLSILIYSQMGSKLYIQKNEGFISFLKGEKTALDLGYDDEYSIDESTIIRDRHWDNNVGFRELKEKHGQTEGLIQMLQWDIERCMNYMWTDERIDKVMNSFEENIHYAYTC